MLTNVNLQIKQNKFKKAQNTKTNVTNGRQNECVKWQSH